MRKALAILVALAIIIPSAAVYASRSLSAHDEDVIYTEDRIYGDISAADGLSVRRNLQYNYHLIWESDIDFSHGSFQTDTGLRYCPDLYAEQFRKRSLTQEYNGLVMSNDYYLVIDPFSSDDDARNGIGNAMKELADATEPGSTGRRTIRVADYMDYYYLNVDIFLPDIYYSSESGRWMGSGFEGGSGVENLKLIRDFFRIPVLEDEYYDIEIDKNTDGSVGSSFGGSAEKGDHFSMRTNCAVSGDAAYIWFSNRAENRENTVDTSLIPGGYGVYKLPYGIRRDEFQKDSKGNTVEYPDVFAEDLKLFYPADPQDLILGLYLNEEETQLILHSVKDGRYVVSIIDTESGEALQQIDIAAYSEEDSSEYFTGEDYCAICISGSYSVIAEENGVWNLALQTEPKGPELEENYMPSTWWLRKSVDYNGEKLAVCGENIIGEDFYDEYFDGYNYYADSGCGFYTAVYGTGGLEYYAVFGSSLDMTASVKERMYATNLRSLDEDGTIVCWK